jgi:hypothetical protein
LRYISHVLTLNWLAMLLFLNIVASLGQAPAILDRAGRKFRDRLGC